MNKKIKILPTRLRNFLKYVVGDVGKLLPLLFAEWETLSRTSSGHSSLNLVKCLRRWLFRAH
jgi:hypothetical protein